VSQIFFFFLVLPKPNSLIVFPLYFIPLSLKKSLSSARSLKSFCCVLFYKFPGLPLTYTSIFIWNSFLCMVWRKGWSLFQHHLLKRVAIHRKPAPLPLSSTLCPKRKEPKSCDLSLWTFHVHTHASSLAFFFFQTTANTHPWVIKSCTYSHNWTLEAESNHKSLLANDTLNSVH
jgi:hypothetical protein